GMTRICSDDPPTSRSLSVCTPVVFRQVTKFRIALAYAPQGDGDPLLCIPYGRPAPRGDLRRRELLQVMQAQQLPIAPMDTPQDALHGESALHLFRVDRRAELRHGVECRCLDEIGPGPAAPVCAACIRNC